MIGVWVNLSKGGLECLNPLGDPVQLTFDPAEVERDAVYDSVFDAVRDVMACKADMRILETFGNGAFELFGLVQRLNLCDVVFEQRISNLLYPRTVREAKARPKGNRGNRRREYLFSTRSVYMPNARMEAVE